MASSPAGVVTIPFAGILIKSSYPSSVSKLSIAAVIDDWEMLSSSAALAIDRVLAAASMYRNCLSVNPNMGSVLPLPPKNR